MDLASHDAHALLGEMQTESLGQLLNAARAPSTGSTQIPTIVSDEQTSPLTTLSRGDLVEIQGPPSSGKTHLLCHLVGTCVLPTSVGGWNKAAILFDVDGTLDVVRIRHLLHTRILRARPPTTDDDRNAGQSSKLLSQALRNFRIFRPSSSLQLAATLSNLQTYHAEDMPSSELALLAIDSMSAFYWTDRFAAEDRRAPPPGISKSSTPSSAQNALHVILEALQRIRTSHGPVIALTNWGLSPQHSHGAAAGLPAYKRHLHPFPTLIAPNTPDPSPRLDIYPPLTHHITLYPPSVATFPPAVLLSDVWKQGEELPPLPGHNEVMGYVKTSRSAEMWTFSLRVTLDEVVVEGRPDET